MADCTLAVFALYPFVVLGSGPHLISRTGTTCVKCFFGVIVMNPGWWCLHLPSSFGYRFASDRHEAWRSRVERLRDAYLLDGLVLDTVVVVLDGLVEDGHDGLGPVNGLDYLGGDFLGICYRGLWYWDRGGCSACLRHLIFRRSPDALQSGYV